MLDELRRGKNVHNRRLARWLTEAEYEGFESDWESQQQIREELRDKPHELRRYENKLHQATFNDNKMHGQGRLEFASGAVYVGGFKDNEKTGANHFHKEKEAEEKQRSNKERQIKVLHAERLRRKWEAAEAVWVRKELEKDKEKEEDEEEERLHISLLKTCT